MIESHLITRFWIATNCICNHRDPSFPQGWGCRDGGVGVKLPELALTSCISLALYFFPWRAYHSPISFPDSPEGCRVPRPLPRLPPPPRRSLPCLLALKGTPEKTWTKQQSWHQWYGNIIFWQWQYLDKWCSLWCEAHVIGLAQGLTPPGGLYKMYLAKLTISTRGGVILWDKIKHMQRIRWKCSQVLQCNALD